MEELIKAIVAARDGGLDMAEVVNITDNPAMLDGLQRAAKYIYDNCDMDAQQIIGELELSRRRLG